jgi:hypothetical protein
VTFSSHRLRDLIPADVSFGGFKPLLGGKSFRAAGGTSVHFVRQATYLRVTALAGVPTNDVGQLGYPEQRLHERPGEDGPARFATDCVVPEGLELVDLAEGAA